ncbi:hypothetical protein Pla22_48700 [Rubripirellula amarantea]|uniref:RanBP2-type domain-containing protein n=1 Tax=Rubripirellula amarantea TaxID=2527999 RepID=A0A5C5WIM3_9BACT|nr:DUF2007 domain-containing protein [Rubripirellula amarantea]TWT49672.1 hypothetical protein Pla22_48700 [Rubripirellula amarantea]
MHATNVTLRYFGDVIEAELIRSRLAVENINATLHNVTHAADIGIGESAIRQGARLEVAVEDYDRAVAILKRDQETLELAGDWTCGECGEPNEPAFELCWNCQAPRSDGSGDLVPDANPLQPPTYAQESEAKLIQTEPQSNPYLPVLIPADHDTSVDGVTVPRRVPKMWVVASFVLLVVIALLLIIAG